ncbi:MAG: hypothetical protein M3Z46_03795 [Actinomycetota bacterium]|nr:hypothetical protein [Actinomycetota bacterium]
MTTSTMNRAQTSPRPDPDRVLRATAVVFLAALLLHGADHLRRGFDVLTPEVFWAGNFQLVTALIAVALVFMGHRWAPLAAMAIGFPSAVGFVASHLLPHWSSFSDAFPGGHVDGWSWGAALVEIAADLAFGLAGWYVLRRTGWEAAAGSVAPKPPAVTPGTKVSA